MNHAIQKCSLSNNCAILSYIHILSMCFSNTTFVDICVTKCYMYLLSWYIRLFFFQSYFPFIPDSSWPSMNLLDICSGEKNHTNIEMVYNSNSSHKRKIEIVFYICIPFSTLSASSKPQLLSKVLFTMQEITLLFYNTELYEIEYCSHMYVNIMYHFHSTPFLLRLHNSYIKSDNSCPSTLQSMGQCRTLKSGTPSMLKLMLSHCAEKLQHDEEIVN